MSWESDDRIQNPDAPRREESWRDAPFAIKLVAGFYALNMLFLLAATPKFAGIDHPASGAVFFLLMVLSVVGLICAIGLLQLRPWAYLGIFGITVLLGLVHLVGLNLIHVLVLGLVLYVLLKNGHYYVDDVTSSNGQSG